MMARDLSVRIGTLTLPNPLIAASGCFGYGLEPTRSSTSRRSAASASRACS